MAAQTNEIPQKNAVRAGLAGVFGTLLAVIGFSAALSELVNRWVQHEEYSHGFLIPVVAFFLLWMRRDALSANVGRPSWTGVVVTVVAVAMNIIGQTAAIFVLSQVGFVVALAGLILGIGGYSLLRAALFPLIFLLFAIPVPNFIEVHGIATTSTYLLATRNAFHQVVGDSGPPGREYN